jgi:hypothetical protein
MGFRPTPATLIAGAALFFALGGSAVAVSQAVKPQARCANGAIRGVAAVTGGGSGVANIPDQFSANKALFARSFNCAGGAVQVRRVQAGIFEVRFVGNGAAHALADPSGHALAAAEPVAGGAFRVSLYVAGHDDPADVAFVVVAV